MMYSSRRSFFSLIYLSCMKIYKKMDSDRVGVYAAQASFFIVISFVPFLMLILTLLRILLLDNAATVTRMADNRILEFMSAVLPVNLFDFAQNFISELAEKPNVSLISVTAVTMLWSASRGVRSVGNGIRSIYKSKSNDGFIKSSLLSLLYTLVFIVGLVAIAIVLFFGSRLGEFFMRKFDIISKLSHLFFTCRGVIFFILLTAVFNLAYNTLSRSEISFFAHFYGAVFSSSIWLLFSWGYSIYINNFANYSYVYGSLTAIILLMLWLYAAMYILLIGAELNIYIYEKRRSIHSD